MAARDDVQTTWAVLRRGGTVGMPEARRLVAAAGNTIEGRRALANLVRDEGADVVIDREARAYLRVHGDLPLPPGVEDRRGDAFFLSRSYTGSRRSTTHAVRVPNEYLYFDIRVGMLLGTLDDVAGVTRAMAHSGYQPVVTRAQGRERAIGVVMVNEFRDTTFGPYKEVILMAGAAPSRSTVAQRTIDFVNAYSLQAAFDRGATMFDFKLWLDELEPIDGGNDYLHTNKELGCFQFEDGTDGSFVFRSWDGRLDPIVRGVLPKTTTLAEAAAAGDAYAAAARGAGTSPPSGGATTIRVASRRDDEDGGPATRWSFDVEWRDSRLQEITAARVNLRFGSAPWAKRFAAFGFRPALAFYAPSGVGQIVYASID